MVIGTAMYRSACQAFCSPLPARMYRVTTYLESVAQVIYTLEPTTRPLRPFITLCVKSSSDLPSSF